MWCSLALARWQIFRFSIDETLDHFKILYLKSVPVFSDSSNAGEPTEHKEFSCIVEPPKPAPDFLVESQSRFNLTEDSLIDYNVLSITTEGALL